MTETSAVDAERLRATLGEEASFALEEVEVFAELDSTNRFLIEHPPREDRALRVCIAEFQTRGRGRRGREWLSPRSAGLCLSVSWRFAAEPADLATITLAAGVAVRSAVETSCGVAPALKWPNDLMLDGRKLGGILVELAATRRAARHVVVGVGLNVAVPSETLANFSDWPAGAIDLHSALGRTPDRTELGARLCLALGKVFVDYESIGFGAYCDAWRRADYLRDAAIVVQRGAEELRGSARGIDDDGALLVTDTSGCEHRIVSGDVSVRLT